MRCFACREPLGEADLFCPRCGAPAPAEGESPTQLRVLTTIAWRLPGYRQAIGGHPELRSAFGVLERILHNMHLFFRFHYFPK